MAFTTLISATACCATSTIPRLAIVDCRFKLDDAGWGAREYAAPAHPGRGLRAPRVAISPAR